MGMVVDRTGALVPVPKVLGVRVLREGDGALLVVDLDGGLGGLLPRTGMIRYDVHEDAVRAVEHIREDIDAGRDPAEVVALVQAGASPAPWHRRDVLERPGMMRRIEEAVAFAERHGLFLVLGGTLGVLAAVLLAVFAAGFVEWVLDLGAACRR